MTNYTIDNGYAVLPVDVDPSIITENALLAIANTLPGWIPRESHIEVLLLEQMAQMTSVSAQVAAQVPKAIFSVYGSLIGITPVQGQAATAYTLWTMTDAQGYTIPANTPLAYSVLGNQTYLFSTVSQFIVSPGYTTTAHDYPNGILIQAQNVGVAYNGLPLAPPASQVLNLVTSLSYVSSVAFFPGGTSGGVDPETTAAYLDRLSNELHYLTPRPILPGDFAGLSTNVPGVYRALGINGLNPFANVLTTLEALFNASVSWTVNAGSPCTLSAYTGGTAPHAMRITGNGANGNPAQVTTAHNSYGTQPPHGYAVAPNQPYIAMLALQNASTSRNVQVQVNCFDVAGDSTGTFASVATANATDLTAQSTLFWVPFTPPNDTFTATIEVVIPGIVNAETHDVYAACLMQMAAPTNLLPDSSFLQVNSPTAAVNPGALTWTLSNAALAVGPFKTNVNGIVYTSTGGTPSYTAKSAATYLSAGTYTVAAWVDATAASGASPTVTVYDATTSANLTVTWAVPIAVGSAEYVYGTFTVPSGGGMIQTAFNTNGTTVASTNTVTFAAPQWLAGSVVPTLPAYTEGPTYGQPGQILNQQRTVTVAAVGDSPLGYPLDSTISQNLSNYLESQREVNFIVNVIPPTYTSIDVEWTATCYDTYNSADVEAAIEQAVKNYLNPVTWALGNYTPPYWDPSQNSIWYLTIVTLIGETPGVQHLESVGIGYTPSTGSTNWQTADLLLPGYAPMPIAGSVKGSVTSA